MNIWNRDLSTAPRDRKVWLASVCGKVVGPTSWDAKREQWAGFSTNGNAPIAWLPYEVPEHPDHAVIAHGHGEINLPILEDVGGGV